MENRQKDIFRLRIRNKRDEKYIQSWKVIKHFLCCFFCCNTIFQLISFWLQMVHKALSFYDCLLKHDIAIQKLSFSMNFKLWIPFVCFSARVDNSIWIWWLGIMICKGLLKRRHRCIKHYTCINQEYYYYYYYKNAYHTSIEIYM